MAVPLVHRDRSSNLRRRLGRLLSAVLATILSACGGGGDGDSSAPVDPNAPTRVGAGRVEITTPGTSTFTTESVAVNVGGDAFISPTLFRCCSGSATDTAVSVTWSSSAGGGGAASQSAQYCQFFFGPFFLCGHTWAVDVPLVMGANQITITATDGAGNTGTDRVTITRTPETAPPVVKATSPAQGATNVAINASITADFSELLAAATINSSTFLLKDSSNNPISGTVSYTNPRATFTPTGPLQGSQTFTATITTGVTDLLGNKLLSDRSWSFTTLVLPDTTPPQVASTNPLNGASCAPVDATVSATFNESIAGTLVSAGTFTLTDAGLNPVLGILQSPSVTQLSLLHDLLSPATTYRATVTTAVKDAAGNPLPANFTWTFSTSSIGPGTWQPISMVGAPTARYWFSSIWTGTEMLIWGGESSFALGSLQTGSRYTPTTDTWAAVATASAPVGRANHVAVWTGSEMIVWGGATSSGYVNSGGRYNPASNTWAAMATAEAAVNRVAATAVWTGSEMIVFGGGTGPDARYNPATDVWSPVSSNGSPEGRFGHTAVWTGAQMIVWGGAPTIGCPSTDCTPSGAAYDPVADSWTPITGTAAPFPRIRHASVWTGSEMAIWGGENTTGRLNSGALYDPQAGTWRAISSNCAPKEQQDHQALWTGSEMLIINGFDSTYLRTGARYDPATSTWRHLPLAGLISTTEDSRAVWAGSQMLVWRGGYLGTASGFRFIP